MSEKPSAPSAAAGKTPLTDAAIVVQSCGEQFVNAELARQLERSAADYRAKWLEAVDTMLLLGRLKERISVLLDKVERNHLLELSAWEAVTEWQELKKLAGSSALSESGFRKESNIEHKLERELSLCSAEQRTVGHGQGWDLYKNCFRDLFGRGLDPERADDMLVSPAALEEMALRLSARSSAAFAKENPMKIRLTEEQSRVLREWIGEDNSAITFHVGEGHGGPGLYASATEYPEDGAEFIAPLP